MIPQIINLQYCYYNLFSQIQVGLLLYSHIPTALVSLLFGGYLLFKSKSLPIITLFIVSLFFALWCFMDLFSWFAFNAKLTMFTWSLSDLFSIIFFLFSYYFLYSFTTKNDLPIWQKIIGIIIVIPTAFWTFFGDNLTAFDGNICEALENESITSYLFYIEGAIFLAVIIFTVFQYIKTKNKGFKKENLFAGIGVAIFLGFFLSATIIASIMTNYESLSQYAYNYEIYGLFGMPILLIYLGFLIVKFKEFNIKAFGAQALIFALIALIGSQFFYATNTASVILTAITLAITGIVGVNLMRSVKKEIDLRERIEKTEKDLEIANSHLKELDIQKTEFISFATHRLRGPLTAVKGYASLLIEGDYGEMTDQVKDAIKVIYESTQSLLLIVGDYLNVSRMEQGRMKYDVAEFDLKTLVEDTVRELKPNLSYAGLTLDFESPKDNFLISADRGKIKEVVSNLIDNATKYTKKGGINIKLEKLNQDKCRLMIKDTGIGIPPEVMPKLFEKFSRAPDASKANIMGTGLGLFVAKAIIEQHKGRIWAESEGSGKGSTFIVELRLVSSDAHVPEALKQFAEGM